MEHALWTLFDAVAQALPDSDAVVWRDRRQSYSQLHDRSLRLATVLDDHGLGRHQARSALRGWESGQDLVATYMLNGPEYLEATLGSYAASAVPFNVNYRYVADELAYLFDDASTAAVVYHARFAPTFADVIPRLRRRPDLLLQVEDGSGEPLLPGALGYESALTAARPYRPDPSPDDLYVLYTGGTTGMPKGTLWRQADIWAAALGGEALGDVTLDEVVDAAQAGAAGGRGRFLPNAPFMHGAAQWVALRTLFSGGTVVINDTVEHLDPAEAWQIVERERIDTVLMVGEAMARPLIAALEGSDSDASSIFAVLLGGAPTSPATKRRLLACLPRALIVDSAGASETGTGLRAITSRTADPGAARFEASADVAVLDATMTRRLAPGDEEEGWFAKTGPIPLGYLGDRAKTEATFRQIAGRRWAVPGDRARWLADGQVELLGRDSVTINTGGEKVFAEEVEAAVLTHPAVVDAVVVGRASERWGQEVVAVAAISDPDVGDDELIAAAARHIARYKLPKAIVRVPVVVRSPSGKADYRWAKRQADAASG